jgi:hypothetical protein
LDADGNYAKAKGKIGRNHHSTIFRKLANRCDFSEPDRFTQRAARRTGISKANKAGLGHHLLNKKARHSSTETNSLYNDPHDTDLHLSTTILHYDGRKENSAPRKKSSGFQALFDDDGSSSPSPSPCSPPLPKAVLKEAPPPQAVSKEETASSVPLPKEAPAPPTHLGYAPHPAYALLPPLPMRLCPIHPTGHPLTQPMQLHRIHPMHLHRIFVL